MGSAVQHNGDIPPPPLPSLFMDDDTISDTVPPDSIFSLSLSISISMFRVHHERNSLYEGGCPLCQGSSGVGDGSEAQSGEDKCATVPWR